MPIKFCIVNVVTCINKRVRFGCFACVDVLVGTELRVELGFVCGCWFFRIHGLDPSHGECKGDWWEGCTQQPQLPPNSTPSSLFFPSFFWTHNSHTTEITAPSPSLSFSDCTFTHIKPKQKRKGKTEDDDNDSKNTQTEIKTSTSLLLLFLFIFCTQNTHIHLAVTTRHIAAHHRPDSNHHHIWQKYQNTFFFMKNRSQNHYHLNWMHFRIRVYAENRWG